MVVDQIRFFQFYSSLNIPHATTEFNYHGELIPIHVKDLCNVQKISHGEFGHVFSIVVKRSTDIPIAVKVCIISTNKKFPTILLTLLCNKTFEISRCISFDNKIFIL